MSNGKSISPAYYFRLSDIFAQAFPPGKHFAIPEWPNVAVVNALGDFAIEADRLAIIDGAGKTPDCSSS
jgi:hypothetical protein